MNERGETEAGPESATEVGAESKPQSKPQSKPESATPAGTEPAPAGTADRRDRGLSRRTWTLAWSTVLVVVLGLVGGFVRVPYIAIGPGPTYDTLSDVKGTPVVTIEGHQTFRTHGQLRMVTVSLTDDITLFGALGLWMSGRYSLAPREDYYQPGVSQQQVDQQNVQEFKDSQSNAEVSALRYLHAPISVVAQQVVTGSPSDKLIAPGDSLVQVNGKPVASVEDVHAALANTTPGQVVDVLVRSGTGPTRDLRITLGSNPDRRQGFLGITPASHADVDYKVTIRLSDIGGPSAGLMFALAVVDKLTNLDVNGGMVVAGTGEIDDIGTVSPIGGIPFKMVAAREDGATVFLTPAANCSEALTHVPAGLQLVKVTTLSSAIAALADLKAHKPVAGC